MVYTLNMQIELTKNLFLSLLRTEDVSTHFRHICEKVADLIVNDCSRFEDAVKQAGQMCYRGDKISAIKFIREFCDKNVGFFRWVMKEYPRPNGHENSQTTGLGLAYSKGLVEYAARFLI